MQDIINGIPFPFYEQCAPKYLSYLLCGEPLLIPRKHNLGQLSKTDVLVTWLLPNKVKTNWANTVIHQMMVMWLPYVYLELKVFKHVSFNIKDESLRKTLSGERKCCTRIYEI